MSIPAFQDENMKMISEFRRAFNIVVKGIVSRNDVDMVKRDRFKWMLLTIIFWVLFIICVFSLLFYDPPEIIIFYLTLFCGLGVLHYVAFLANDSAMSIIKNNVNEKSKDITNNGQIK